MLTMTGVMLMLALMLTGIMFTILVEHKTQSRLQLRLI